MKVTGINSVQGVLRPIEITAKNKADKPRGNVDTYQPTTLAGEFNLARRAILATPDIRTAKVEDIANRINTGDYSITATDLADRILDQAQ